MGRFRAGLQREGDRCSLADTTRMFLQQRDPDLENGIYDDDRRNTKEILLSPAAEQYQRERCRIFVRPAQPDDQPSNLAAPNRRLSKLERIYAGAVFLAIDSFVAGSDAK